jgi:hypothetical protein
MCSAGPALAKWVSVVPAKAPPTQPRSSLKTLAAKPWVMAFVKLKFAFVVQVQDVSRPFVPFKLWASKSL